MRNYLLGAAIVSPREQRAANMTVLTDYDQLIASYGEYVHEYDRFDPTVPQQHWL